MDRITDEIVDALLPTEDAVMINVPNSLLESLQSPHLVEGLTHNFYRYPARFAPEFVREVILEFSREGDCVLDAFMGGGTTIVEAIVNGRIALGIDGILRLDTLFTKHQAGWHVEKWFYVLEVYQSCNTNVNMFVASVSEGIMLVSLKYSSGHDKCYLPSFLKIQSRTGEKEKCRYLHMSYECCLMG